MITDIKFDFDDILIVPDVRSDISSRYKDITLPEIFPLFTAPMDTVVDLKNMDYFMDGKINVTLPRTIKYDQFKEYVRNENMQFYDKVFISLGFNDILEHVPTMFLRFHSNAHILIDVANGHMEKIVEFAKMIKNSDQTLRLWLEILPIQKHILGMHNKTVLIISGLVLVMVVGV